MFTLFSQHRSLPCAGNIKYSLPKQYIFMRTQKLWIKKLPTKSTKFSVPQVTMSLQYK